MTHPIKTLLDTIWNQGHTPMVIVDSRHEDVVVPEHIRKQYCEKLLLTLKAADPLNIVFDEVGIHADLAFQGLVQRCTLPWTRIYVVLDTDTDRGIQIGAHTPSANDYKAVKEEIEKLNQSIPPRGNPFRVIKGGKVN